MCNVCGLCCLTHTFPVPAGLPLLCLLYASFPFSVSRTPNSTWFFLLQKHLSLSAKRTWERDGRRMKSEELNRGSGRRRRMGKQTSSCCCPGKVSTDFRGVPIPSMNTTTREIARKRRIAQNLKWVGLNDVSRTERNFDQKKGTCKRCNRFVKWGKIGFIGKQS